MKRKPIIGIIAKHYDDPNGLWSDGYSRLLFRHFVDMVCVFDHNVNLETRVP